MNNKYNNGIQKRNPFTGKSVGKFDELTDEQLEAKIAKAASCCQSWKKKSYAERAVIVAKAAELIRAKVDKFARTPLPKWAS